MTELAAPDVAQCAAPHSRGARIPLQVAEKPADTAKRILEEAEKASPVNSDAEGSDDDADAANPSR